MRVLAALPPEVEAAIRDELGEVGDAVRQDAEFRFSRYSVKSAAGFKVQVKKAGLVRVEQSLRKTTGLHPEWGAKMMTAALLPARDAKLEGAVAGLEERIALVFTTHGF